MPTVFILTAVHNNLKKTKLLLASIRKQVYPNILTVIVDDGSTDGTHEFLSKHPQKLEVIEGNGKLWWTGSLFLGVEYILGAAGEDDYVLTINNDCEFDKDYISNLVYSAGKFKRSIVGSLIINKNDGKIWDAGVNVDWEKAEFCPLINEAKVNIDKHLRYGRGINVLPTKGTIFPVEVFRKIGNFDKKNFPHYLSDFEFTYRAYRNGFNLLVDYEAKVFNDTRRTGIGGDVLHRTGWKDLFSLLFSRRSRVNIVDQLNIIRIACPNEYKLRNYLFLVLKIIHSLLQVWPFVYIEKAVILIKRLYLHYG